MGRLCVPQFNTESWVPVGSRDIDFYRATHPVGRSQAQNPATNDGKTANRPVQRGIDTPPTEVYAL